MINIQRVPILVVTGRNCALDGRSNVNRRGCAIRVIGFAVGRRGLSPWRSVHQKGREKQRSREQNRQPRKPREPCFHLRSSVNQTSDRTWCIERPLPDRQSGSVTSTSVAY